MTCVDILHTNRSETMRDKQFSVPNLKKILFVIFCIISSEIYCNTPFTHNLKLSLTHAELTKNCEVKPVPNRNASSKLAFMYHWIWLKKYLFKILGHYPLPEGGKLPKNEMLGYYPKSVLCDAYMTPVAFFREMDAHWSIMV